MRPSNLELVKLVVFVTLASAAAGLLVSLGLRAVGQ